MRWTVLSSLLLTAACSAPGSLTVTTYGEDYIEVGIPAASGPEAEGMVDGFSVRYDRFLVVLAGVTVANRDGDVAVEAPDAQVFDLAKPGPHEVASFAELPAERWDRVSARIVPSTTLSAGNVTSEDVDRMRDAGWSVYAEGVAERGTEQVTFAWGFDTATRYEACEDANALAGVNVPTGGSLTAELTIHGDHLFYDDLQSEDPALRFEAFANADTDADGDVTLAELAAVSLVDLPLDQYGTGGDPSVHDLAAFVRASTRTLLHFQGEGHCNAVRER